MPELKGTYFAVLRFIYQNLPISSSTKNRLKENYLFGWDLLDQLRASGAKETVLLSYYSAERANIGSNSCFSLH